tara:strand:+ start:301 stop:1866 length:1566 start_codon:yes stop_codon:yes gene_type:complete
MGIKNFYYIFQNKCKEVIDNKYDKHDILIIDLNGIFYNSCNMILKDVDFNEVDNIKLFETITENIYNIIKKFLPTKKICLVVDGIAGSMKVCEQRQRRFKNILENKYKNFDINCLSPGTKMMNHITKYIDWFLKKKISFDDELKHYTIYFMNEKVVGEGEIKIKEFIEKYCTLDDKILIYSSDSDLIILSILLEHNITIYRHSSNNECNFINIQKCKQLFLKKLAWKNSVPNRNIVDFIILIFLLGNDYVNNIPLFYNFDILFDIVIPIYQKRKEYLHKLVANDKYIIDIKNIISFFKNISKLESFFLTKHNIVSCSYFPNELNGITNISEYKDIYNNKYFNNIDIENVIIDYFKCMQNVLDLYINNSYKWNFFYKYNKVPFLSDFYYNKKIEDSINFFAIDNDIPFECIFNLFLILPLQSQNLLPCCLKDINTLRTYFPSKIEIDLEGKKRLWEGNIILPNININDFKKEYNKKKELFNNFDKQRNNIGKTIIYSYSDNEYLFESFYGNIEKCKSKCIIE